MKQIQLIIILLFITLQSCGQQLEQVETNELIATKNGFDLTEADFETYLNYIEENAGETADIATQILIKSQLKETFLKEPEKLLNQLQLLSGTENIETPDIQTPTRVKPKVNYSDAHLAEGHAVVRNVLGNDIGQMQFNVTAANMFRQYVANSLLTSSTGSFDKSVGGTSTTSTTDQIQFCANGTYTEALSGSVGVDVPGGWVDSNDTTNITGYWDVATLPNAMMIIVMYSTHPYVLEDWPNGVMPFVVAEHGADFVAMPSGDLYRRTANQYCN